MLYGIIDIGSNTIRMAIYLIEGNRVEFLMKQKHRVGLAAYVHDGVMSPEGIAKAVEVLQEFKGFLYSFNITKVFAFTTAALRNCKNSEAAVGIIEHALGLPVRVISGDEEATFDFVGALHGIPAEDGLLVDIGGGSTEIVSYKSKEICKKVSLPIGSLLFHSKYVNGILPDITECLEMYREAEATIGAETAFADVREAALIGIGGSFKGGLALYNELFNQPAVNTRMEARRLSTLVSTFLRDHGVSQEMTIMLMKAVPERLKTVIPGLIIADVMARRFQCREITYSDSGVREGFIYSEIVGKNN
jgi:exopolyphosphatase/guanosine-5'-triphosphate,3'-diphosphate pyrophosphatase